MSTPELVLEFIKSLAYPITVLLIFYVLKKPIKELITAFSRVLSGKVVARYGSASVEFGQAVQESDKEALREFLRKTEQPIPLDGLYGKVETKVGPLAVAKERERLEIALKQLLDQGQVYKDRHNRLAVSGSD